MYLYGICPVVHYFSLNPDVPISSCAFFNNNAPVILIIVMYKIAKRIKIYLFIYLKGYQAP
jgi:hypothetical protein